MNNSLVPLSDCSLQTCDISRSHFATEPPVFPAALSYIIYFALFLILQSGLGVWYRTWSLLAGAFSCLLLYTLGYVAAAKMTSDPFSDSWFALYLFGLTVAPSLLTASLVICAQQIATISMSGVFPLVEGKYRHVTIGLQIIGVFFQVVGMAVMAGNTSLSLSQSGADVAVFGLAIQVLTLTLACGACVISAYSLFRHSGGLTSQKGREEDATEDNKVSKPLRHSKMLKAYVVVFIVVLLSTLVSTIMFAVMIAGGREGQQLRVQNLYYYQGYFMALAVFLLTACHPGLGLKRSRKDAIPDIARDPA
ncbi:hypothetical protein MMC10_007331 [Thelotrema lepadinum]|nr:hypothetical protein [Thelotrema lepadinum]